MKSFRYLLKLKVVMGVLEVIRQVKFAQPQTFLCTHTRYFGVQTPWTERADVIRIG